MTGTPVTKISARIEECFHLVLGGWKRIFAKMINGQSKRDECAESDRKKRKSQCAVLVVVCGLVIGVYAWSARSGFLELTSSKADFSYYNLLVDGFRSGQLNLKREVPAELAQLAGVCASSSNRTFFSELLTTYPLLDLSYYKGKLYLYFGVTPALILFWPFVAITGHYLLHKDAVAIFF